MKKRKIIIFSAVFIILLAFGIGIGIIRYKENLKKQIAYEMQLKQQKEQEEKERLENENLKKEREEALRQVKLLSSGLNLSKKRIYNDLTAGKGKNFSPEVVQYAIDNSNINFKENALETLKTLKKIKPNMSIERMYIQLTSQYGGQFTEEEAQYAIDNLD